MADTFTITSSTMTGAEVEYTIPKGTRKIYFQPPAADVTVATTSSGAVWTITASEVYRNGFNVNRGGQTLYLTGTSGQVLKILLEK